MKLQKQLKKKIEKIQFMRLIECSFQSIEQELRIDRVIQKLRGEFLQFFDRSRIPFDQSIVNRESIESSRDLKMYLLTFQSIERYLRPIEHTIFEISLSIKT